MLTIDFLKGEQNERRVPVELKFGRREKKFLLSKPRWPSVPAIFDRREIGSVRIGDFSRSVYVYVPRFDFRSGTEFVRHLLSGRFIPGRRPLVGIDFGSDSVKAVELIDDGEKLCLKRCDSEPLRPDCLVDGTIMNFVMLNDSLSALVRRLRLTNRRVAFGVSGLSTIFKRLSLPQMSEEEFERGLPWEAEQYIPFDINEVFVAAEVVEPNAGQGQMGIVMCAAHKDIVNDYVNAMNEAKMMPVVADFNCFALCNLFERLYSFPKMETVALIDIGASRISVVIVTNGVIEFHREIFMGGALLVEEIQRMFNVDFQTADGYRKNIGSIPAPGGKSAVGLAVDKVAKALIVEIQRSVEFFKATSVGERITKVYTTGGASEMAGLTAELSRRLDVPVEALDCFKGVEIDPNRFDVAALSANKSKYAVAMGLALRRG